MFWKKKSSPVLFDPDFEEDTIELSDFLVSTNQKPSKPGPAVPESERPVDVDEFDSELEIPNFLERANAVIAPPKKKASEMVIAKSDYTAEDLALQCEVIDEILPQ